MAVALLDDAEDSEAPRAAMIDLIMATALPTRAFEDAGPAAARRRELQVPPRPGLLRLLPAPPDSVCLATPPPWGHNW